MVKICFSFFFVKRVVQVYPKGYGTVVEDHLALFLCVANPESLKLGWKRRANNSVLLLDQFGKELYRSNENCRLFCAQFTKWGESRGLPLKDKWILEKNKLIIKVDIKVVEVVDEAQVTGMEMLDLFGFQFFYSQVRYPSLLLFSDMIPFSDDY